LTAATSVRENVEVCKKVVDTPISTTVSWRAHWACFVGGKHEAGEEGGGIQGGVTPTRSEAVEFVRQTGVDSLAVAIGNSHGAYKYGRCSISIWKRL